MYSSIICNTLGVVLAAVLLKVLPLWNPDFADQLKNAADLGQFSKNGLLRSWDSSFISNILLIIIFLVSMAETGYTVYKTLKYAHSAK